MAAKKRHYRHLPAFILLLLAQEEAHGGAVHSLLSERLPDFQTDTGAVYRSLQQLEKDGSVVSVWDTTESGPARKIYRITSTGWGKLGEWEQDIKCRLANLNYFLETYEKINNKKQK